MQTTSWVPPQGVAVRPSRTPRRGVRPDFLLGRLTRFPCSARENCRSHATQSACYARCGIPGAQFGQHPRQQTILCHPGPKRRHRPGRLPVPWMHSHHRLHRPILHRRDRHHRHHHLGRRGNLHRQRTGPRQHSRHRQEITAGTSTPPGSTQACPHHYDINLSIRGGRGPCQRHRLLSPASGSRITTTDGGRGSSDRTTTPRHRCRKLAVAWNRECDRPSRRHTPAFKALPPA